MRLTPAEERAMDALLRHGTAKEAAASLGKSVRTIEHQLQSARHRYGVERTIQLVRVIGNSPE